MPADTALLIIDVQKAMFPESGAVYGAEALLEKLVALIARARAAGVPVVYVQHCGGPGDDLEPGSPGWPIHPAVAPQPGDPVVQKYHPDAFQDTPLRAELDRLGARRLVIAGLQTEYCIDTTSRRAYSLGYPVVLAQDAHSTWDSGGLTAEQIIAHHNAVLSSWFVTLRPAASIDFGKRNDL